MNFKKYMESLNEQNDGLRLDKRVMSVVKKFWKEHGFQTQKHYKPYDHYIVYPFPDEKKLEAFVSTFDKNAWEDQERSVLRSYNLLLDTELGFTMGGEDGPVNITVRICPRRMNMRISIPTVEKESDYDVPTIN